jgi:predicted metal-dependent hydrolase
MRYEISYVRRPVFAQMWIACGRMRCVLRHDLDHGIRLFNDAAFFDAHEALEDVWRAAPAAEKKFFQGLIQIAVALHHHGNGNVVGARSVLRRAFRNLSLYPEGFGGIESAPLLHSISDWQHALDDGTPVPALPKIVASR